MAVVVLLAEVALHRFDNVVKLRSKVVHVKMSQLKKKLTKLVRICSNIGTSGSTLVSAAN